MKTVPPIKSRRTVFGAKPAENRDKLGDSLPFTDRRTPCQASDLGHPVTWYRSLFLDYLFHYLDSIPESGENLGLF